MDRRSFLGRTAPLALLTLAGCTDGDTTSTGEDSPTATASSTEPEEATGSPTPTQEPSPDGTSTDQQSPDGTATDGTASPTPEPTPASDADQEVVVGPEGRLRFEPQSFTVAAGDTVLWRWDSPGHNVSPTEGKQPSGADWSGKDEKTYGSGTTYAYTFDVVGDYAYHCDPHQSSGMVGSFTVE